jgi:hypothetical protein
MGALLTSLPVRGPFQPRFILAQELALYGLPDASVQSNILSLVDGASSLIDEYCGRTDGNGQGSLVYTTYMERILFQARGRNIVRVSFKPMAVVPASVVQTLTASANAPITTEDPLMSENYFWTGVQANTISGSPTSSLSPILGASGRYGYGRRSEFAIYPDLNYGMNALQLASFFGGPPAWTPIDVTQIDFAPDTGEVWVPAGLYLSQYTEMIIIYNSGYHPLYMPRSIKQACAAIVRNMLARGGGTTGIKGIQAAGSVNVQFTDDIIDTTVQRWLDAYKNVIAY